MIIILWWEKYILSFNLGHRKCLPGSLLKYLASLVPSHLKREKSWEEMEGRGSLPGKTPHAKDEYPATPVLT